MKTNNITENWIRQKKLEPDTPASMDSRILMDSYVAMPSAQEQPAESGYRRIFMKTSVKLTAAAVILIAAVLSLTLWDKTVTPAYALEQTIQAFHSMQTIHVKLYYPGYPSPALVWAEYGEDGQIKALRVSQPEMLNPSDGDRESVLKDNIAQVWLKKRNMVFYIHDQAKAAEVGALFQEVDPKLLVQKLEEMQRKGTAQIEIEQPAQIDKPIIITATLTIEDPLFGHRVVAIVDQATKLVTSLETLKGDGTLSYKNGHFEINDFNKLEFLNYNQPFEKDIFVLNVPKDVAVADLITKVIGLEQGQMTLDEVAIAVVRCFWDNILKQDYEAAGLMYQGIPGDLLKNNCAGTPSEKINRIVSTGPTKPHPNPDYKDGVLVPCTIEFTRNGQIEQKTSNFFVIPVHGQPGRWTIAGEF